MADSTILVVEDDAHMRDTLGATLRKAGYAVEAVGDFREARSKICKENYGLILTDLKMPNGSGMDVLEEVKSVNPSIPVIVMAAYGTVQAAVAAMKAGATDFIQKPFAFDALKEAIRRSLKASVGSFSARLDIRADEIPKQNLRIRGAPPRAQSFGTGKSLCDTPTQNHSRGVRSIAVTSGKGGVGKTCIVANLGHLLSAMGTRVMILDADVGLANIDLLLGLSPQYTLKDFLEGETELSEILMKGPGGMVILPAGSGVMELTNLERDQRLALLGEINALSENHDLLLIDTPAGVSSNVIHFNALAQEIIVVVTPEPTSISDAYALIKVMFLKHRRRRFFVLVNETKSEKEAQQTFQGLNHAVERFLNFSLTDLGFISWDSCVSRSVKRQRAFAEAYPNAKATQNLHQVALRLQQMNGRKESFGELTLFGPYA